MSYTPPPSPPPQERPPLNFEEFLAVAVAFSAMGAILFWGLTRSNHDISDHFPFPSDQNSSNTSQGGADLGTGNAGSNLSPGGEGSMLPLRPTPSPKPEVNPGDNSSTNIPIAVARPAPVTSPVNPSNPNNVDGNASLEVPPPSQLSPDMAVQPVEVPPTQTPIIFADVPPEHWSKPFLDNLSSRGLLTGFPDGTYQPDQPMTRAELAAQISALFDSVQTQSPPIAFTDVSPDYWAYDSIQEAVVMGFLKGYPEQTFKPDQIITRAQAITAIASGLNLSTTQPKSITLTQYSDSTNIPVWATGSVAAATEAGIVVNHPDLAKLNPEQPMTRAEAAAMLHQALVYMGSLDPINSTTIVNGQ